MRVAGEDLSRIPGVCDWQIASTGCEIRPQIPQDVHELESFSVGDPLFEKDRLRRGGKPPAESQETESGPERSHATRDSPRVILQRGFVL